MRAPAQALILLLALAPVTPLCASEDRAAPLSLRDAMARTLADSPTLATYPWRERADDARVLQAGLGPNPELAAEIENIGGSGVYSGTSAMNLTFALSQVIELGDKRDNRREVALAGSRLTGFDYELARLDVLVETS